MRCPHPAQPPACNLLAPERQGAVHLGNRTREQVHDLGIHRVLREVDELLSMLSCEQAGQIALRQPVVEQNLTEPASALGCFRKRSVDGLEWHQDRKSTRLNSSHSQISYS